MRSNETLESKEKKHVDRYTGWMDYGPLIKRNFIKRMDQHSGEHLGTQYKNTLILLPNHPILGIKDLEHMITSVKIATEMKHMIDTGENLLD
jgi:hypothetical protein